MLEIRKADLLPFGRVKSLATAAYAAKYLAAFTVLRRLYPDDVDQDEARRIHELLCWLIETSLQEPLLNQIKWTTVPFDPPVCPAWIAGIGGAGIAFSIEPLGIDADLTHPVATAERTFNALEGHIAPTLLDVIRRLTEILCFDMNFPHPSDEPAYGEGRRALFMFGKYWDSYRPILDQHGAAHVSTQPHPMIRFIESLHLRLREYAKRIGDEELQERLDNVLAIEFDGDSQAVWEDWAQPQINRLQRAFEQLRIRLRSGTSDLTAAEDLFLQTTAAVLTDVSREARVHWHFLHEAASRPERTGAFPPPLYLSCRRDGARHEVLVDSIPVLLTDQNFALLLRLLRARIEDGDGWLDIERPGGDGLVETGFLSAEPDQAINRLRGEFTTACLPHKPTELFVRSRGQLRLTTPGALVTWDERQLLAITDQVIAAEARAVIALRRNRAE